MADEFSYVKQSLKGENYTRYLQKRGIPEVLLENRHKKGTEIYWSVAIDQNGNDIKQFSSKDTVTKLASGRYKKISYLLVSRNHPCGNTRCSENLLIDSNRRISVVADLPWKSTTLATHVGQAGELYAISKEAFILDLVDKKTTYLAVPESIISAHIGSNVDGMVSAIAVAEAGQLYWSDGKQWKQLSMTLTPHSDRTGIAAIYPRNSNSHYIVLYRYLNEYNKGLYTFRFNPLSGKEEGGWLFNSENRNVGFDPGIYSKSGGEIIIVAKNSSIDKLTYFKLSENDFTKMEPALPSYIVQNDNQDEKFVSLVLGTSITKNSWQANSKVEKADVTFIDIDYQIADSLFTSVNFEGRIGDTSLAINYLQNKTEDLFANEIDSQGNVTSKQLSKRASHYLFSSIDFQGLLSPSSMLRVQAEIAETNGIAQIKHNNGSVIYQDFSTEVKRLAILVMQERGYFIGGDYITYNTPSAIGFSDDSKSIAYINFDPEFGFQALRFVFGYDALSYAKRYESNFNKFYWAGSGNLGLGFANISPEIEQQALTTTGENKIDNLPVYFTFGADLELGHLWQQRFKSLKGFGYTISLGYRGSYSTMGSGQSDESKPVAGTLYLEFERTDILHGPFIKANIIF